MSLSQEFNSAALRLWEAFPNESKLMPAQYADKHFSHGQKLLLLGMNPAFGARWIQNRISKDHWLGKENADLLAEVVYGWDSGTGGIHIEHLLTLEAQAFKSYGVFFNSQKSFAEKVGCSDSYSHFDLFHVRQTDQNDFLSTVRHSGDLTPFSREQIALTRRTICNIAPEVVVIANATASRMALKYLDLEFFKDSRTQCILPRLEGTRFFLAGMLSGVRAMDTFSRNRLEDEVKLFMART